MDGRCAAVLACTLLWSDAFPVNAPNQGAVYQEVKVEVCERLVEVSMRVYQEIATRDGREEYEIRGWSPIKSHWVKREKEGEREAETPERQ